LSDKHNIDSHKLVYHPRRVADWLEGRNSWELARSIYPIYVEISPIGACNHRCTFCSVDYLGYQTRSLAEEVLRERLTGMARLGIKSVMFAGEGEPALWKPLPRILDHCTEVGIDSSMTTNMVPFTTRNVEQFVRNCAWIKTSINAGSAGTYARIHQTKASDFDLVLDNFRLAVETRDRGGYRCTIGSQILLLPENAHEVTRLAETLRGIGVDYLVVKPYTQSLYGLSRKYEGLRYDEYAGLEADLAALNTDRFSVVYRGQTMARLNEEIRAYDRCLATPFFWAYIMSTGDLYGCSAFLGNDKFCYGNLYETGFKQLWEGERRQASYHHVRNELDIGQCRINCRMDAVNRYLTNLVSPDPHVNFI
jgi:cyclic pyranopterin phosphate synthase